MAFIRRNIIKKSPSSGYRVIVVVGDDTTNEVNNVQVTLSSEGGAPAATPSSMILPLKKINPNGNKRYVFTDVTFASDPVGLSYNMTSTMKDSNDNSVGTPVTSSVAVKSDGDPRLSNVVIKQLNGNNFLLKVVVVADDMNEVNSVDVLFDGDLDGLALPNGATGTTTTISISPASSVSGGKKVFKQGITFANPADEIDQVWTLNISLKNSGGEVLSTTEELVTVEGLEVA